MITEEYYDKDLQGQTIRHKRAQELKKYVQNWKVNHMDTFVTNNGADLNYRLSVKFLPIQYNIDFIHNEIEKLLYSHY